MLQEMNETQLKSINKNQVTVDIQNVVKMTMLMFHEYKRNQQPKTYFLYI